MRYDRLILLFAIALMLTTPVAAQTSKRAVSKQKPAAAVEREEENVPADRITIEHLKRKMDAKEKIVIIDTRKGGAWIGASVKIKGARHITADELETQMKTLPRNREIVAYCA